MSTTTTAVSGRLFGNRIVVWDIVDSRKLYGSGYYGKPLGVPKPKGVEFDAPLVLDLMEGCYLAEKGRLKISQMDGRPVSQTEIKKICKKQYVDFDAKYLVFSDLREKGYVVSPGIKFGCDFAVYEQGPGIDHAPYLVQVFRATDEMTATGIVLAGRLATTVKKQFILAIPKVTEKKVEYVGFDWWRA
ncbi:tRNA-intron lyase [Nitrososphaera viennensis]|uniref:tRNA-splicing endonuclease n=2 Tax=Nitrososphaera viennensis TaxID=1034015 RepID=A0A060HD49_9ARCH|nr:tRNA-intron lyase [Nitrososphaera viennensis]AIC14664.1 tRNA-splicing endonuclease [Nitrososphaera viennensis EN76]UVS69628.1 tRNA-intron lyase [Nitrososphaera viennensis]